MAQAFYSPNPVPEMNVRAYGVQISANQPRFDEALIHAMQVQVATIPPRIPAEVFSHMVYVAVRADHRPGGGYYPISSTDGSEDDQVLYYDLIFPKCIAYGSTGSPKYVTEKVEVDSGAEQRNQRRAYPRHEYKIEMENVPANEVSEIMNLWHVCAGDHIGFLFLDPMDHTSANSDAALSGEEVSNTDQFVGAGVGSKSEYQLFKEYKSGPHNRRRRIRYPDVGTLTVAVDGRDIGNWEYDLDNCVLRFRNTLSVSGVISRTNTGIMSGADFSGFAPGDLVYVEGYSSDAYNALPGGDPARVVSADDTTLVVQRYNGTAYGVGVYVDQDITITHALPPTGSEITAGFYFYVPVRFDDGDNMESEIKSGMRDSVFADFTQITLREVFE